MTTYSLIGTAAGAAGSGSLTPTMPSYAAGDLALFHALARTNTETINSPPSGYVLLAEGVAGYGSEANLAVYGKKCTASESAPSVGFSGTGRHLAVMSVLRSSTGWPTLTTAADIVVDSVDASGSGAGLTAEGINAPPENDCCVYAVCGKNSTDNDATSVATPSGYTNAALQIFNSATAGQILAAWFQGQTTAAAVASQAAAITPTNGTLRRDRITLVLRGTVAAGAGWTADPVVTSQTATVYTVGFTPSAAATIYGVAVVAGSAAPSIAQVKAGQNAAGGTAKAANSKAVTGIDTLTLTPSDSPAFPRYDLYFVLNNGGGDSSLQSLLSEYLDPPSGKSFTTLTSVHSSSPFVGTVAAVNDTVVIDTATDPDAYVVTCGVDGTVSYAAAGDSSRQLVDADVYDYSAGAYLGAGTIVFNNLAPDSGGVAFPDPLLYRRSVAISALSLIDFAPDPESDTVVVTALDALPTGLSISSSQLVGTPSVYGSTNTQLEWEDQYGSTYVETVTIQIGDLVTDVVGDAQAAAVAAIEAVASFTTSLISEYSTTVPEGDVISQAPAAGELAEYDTNVELTVSLGIPGPKASRDYVLRISPSGAVIGAWEV